MLGVLNYLVDLGIKIARRMLHEEIRKYQADLERSMGQAEHWQLQSEREKEKFFTEALSHSKTIEKYEADLAYVREQLKMTDDLMREEQKKRLEAERSLNYAINWIGATRLDCEKTIEHLRNPPKMKTHSRSDAFGVPIIIGPRTGTLRQSCQHPNESNTGKPEEDNESKRSSGTARRDPFETISDGVGEEST